LEINCEIEKGKVYMGKKRLAEERIYKARMIKDSGLYTAQEVFEMGLGDEEFVDPDKTWALTYVAPYSRKGRTDKHTLGADKPRVYVNAYFRKKLSLRDRHELYPINVSLIRAEYTIHKRDSDWHNEWKDRVRPFCEIEKRFYPGDVPQGTGYKIADAYYEEAGTVIEFQKSFADDALEKSSFYKEKNIRLIWLFYLQTLAVFQDEGKYKVREDNLYHFFRIEDIKPGFYKDNVIFIQDKTNKIYYVDKLRRVESSSILEATVRYFECKHVFNSPEDFARWLKDDWVSSDLYNEHCEIGKGKDKEESAEKVELKSLDEILLPFVEKEEKMFYLQNGIKKDKNGKNLIYCFVKDDDEVRMAGSSYTSYRCFAKNEQGYYVVNKKWLETPQNAKEKKWILLSTNLQKYSDEVKVK
jgi:hypothetical protein